MAAEPPTPAPVSEAGPKPPAPVRVELTRDDFAYFNWTLALERPVLPFLMATFVLCALAGLLGVLPNGTLLAGAALVPALLYAFFVWSSTRMLWRRNRQIGAPRRYRFDARGYRVAGPGGEDRVPFDEVRRGIATRRAAYLVRQDGSADLLPWRLFEDEAGARDFLALRLGRGWRRSSWL